MAASQNEDTSKDEVALQDNKMRPSYKMATLQDEASTQDRVTTNYEAAHKQFFCPCKLRNHNNLNYPAAKPLGVNSIYYWLT